MLLAKVVGTVTCSVKADNAYASTYLLVDMCDQSGKGSGNIQIALDMIGVGNGEMVMICTGSAARQTKMSMNMPVNAVIAGIVDIIDEGGRVVYKSGA